MKTVGPFLKWVGGKTQLLPELLKRVPEKYGAYYEPFIGGGALFFALKPQRAVIGDLNSRLVRTYRALQTNVDEVIALLRVCKERHTPEWYYAMRDIDVDGLTDVQVAMWFIYINKTCFNGLHRVNKAGKINTPVGRYKNPAICDEANLRACAAALTGTTVFHGSYEVTSASAVPGDFVYFDSPYVPVSETADFTSYTATGFSRDDQVRLADHARVLRDRGVHVLLSNAAAPVVEKLYRERGFTVDTVSARRNVNSKGTKRGPVDEYLIS